MIQVQQRFKLGQLVLLRTDPDKKQRLATSVRVSIAGSVTYCLVHGETAYWAFDGEIESINGAANDEKLNEIFIRCEGDNEKA
jgi:hypothetical protein